MTLESAMMRNLGGVGPVKQTGQRKLYRRRTAQVAEENRFDVQTVGAFKLTPSFLSSHFTTNRPLMGQCCSCLPRSGKDLVSSEFKELGMRNILDVRSEMNGSSGIERLFPLESYALQRPLFRKFPDVSKSVVLSPRVLEAIQATAEQMLHGSQYNETEMSKQIMLCEKQCAKIMKTMKASVSSAFISLTAWFLTRFLGKFLRSVQVCRGQMMMVKQASQKEIPMIYLPLHRSHLDYILVTLILWHYDIRAPHVAAGDNMDIPVFSTMMRALGGFFIRRRLDTVQGEKDLMYRAVLHEYMSRLLQEGEGLEFFIEGGRTRTGRSVNPKGGLLSVVVEAFDEGMMSDAYIVPVSFSYEKIIDGDYCREQVGSPKVRETFWGAVKAIFRVVFGNYGNVRVDFAQPFSLSEFIQRAKECNYSPISELPPMSRSMEPRESYPNFSQLQLSTNGDNAYDTRMVVKALADHVVYTNDRCTPPMATHLIAFLLLTKYRQGVYMRELVQAVHWIVRELQGLHVDVGFCGQSEDAILYAQNLLGDKLISKKYNSEINDIKFYPTLSLPSVFEISYYANLVSSHFALESVVAAAVIYESGLSLFHLSTSNPIQETKITRERLLETSEELCKIIHSEYILVPPCMDTNRALCEMVESFISKEVLSVEDAQADELLFVGKDRRWAQRLAMTIDVDEEDSSGEYRSQQELIVNLDRIDIRERLNFLVAVLGPLFESYLLVGKYALEELGSEQEETLFLKSLGIFARQRVEEDVNLYSESCAMINLKSAVKSLQELGLLYSYREAGITMVGLSEQAGARTVMENYVELLQSILS